MNPKTCLIAGCLPLGIGGMLLVLMAVAFLGMGGSGGEGEEISTSSGQVATGTDAGADAGPISDSVPEVLAALFKEAGGKVGVPAALIAAISHQECGRMWDAPTEVLTKWVKTNVDVDERGCNFDNGYRVWGPMQFQDTTFGIPKGANARLHPQPRAGSYGDQASSYTGNKPPSMLNVRDAVYAAAIKLHRDGGKPTNWTEVNVEKAAKRYFGACAHTYTDRRSGRRVSVNYCRDIIAKWKKFSGEL